MNAAEEIDVTIEGVLADGTPVKAKCRYRAKDISVELLSPYPGLHAGRHIMFMSPWTYTANEYWKRPPGNCLRNSWRKDGGFLRIRTK